MSIQCVFCRHENSDTAVVCAACNAPLKPVPGGDPRHAADKDISIFGPGDLIGDHYLVVEKIGDSSFALLYQVRDTEDGDKEYFLNLLHPGLSSDPQAKQRFKDEIAVCMDLVHPPTILVDRLQSGQDIYYYLTGPSLEKYQLDRKGTTPPFSLAEIRTVMRSLLQTLDYAHQFTQHNHISPETIVLLGTFPDVSVRLLDPGNTGALVASHLAGTLSDTRSLVYMAPEQIKNPLSADLRADLFSVGMILYEMLTGEQAVGVFAMPSEIFSDHYSPLDKVIKKALASDIDRRHESAGKLFHDISSALDEVEKSIKKSTGKTEQGQPATGAGIRQETETMPRRSDESSEQQKPTATTDKEPEKTPDAVKPPHESRSFFIVFFVLLCCAAAGGYVLFFKDKTTENTLLTGKTGNRSALVIPIEPSDNRRIPGKVDTKTTDTLTGIAALPDTGTEKNKGLLTDKTENQSTFVIPAEPSDNRRIKSKVEPRATARLTIITNPPDARIELVNGPQYKAGMDLTGGTHRIKISKKGFVSRELDIVISPGKDTTVPVHLIPEKTTGHLTISPFPPDAAIRILNIKPVYHPNMQLAVGRYHVEVSADGYSTMTRWVTLPAGENLNIKMVLIKKKNKEKKGKKSLIKAAGMELVFVKGGCYNMGQGPEEKKQLIHLRGQIKYEKSYSDEIPRHEVCIDGFYMGRHEVTIGQWNTFVQKTGYRTDAEKNSGGRNGCYSLLHSQWTYVKGRSWSNTGFPQSAEHPVACVSYNDITAYIKWLNTTSGRQFRLPTEAEWEYAARGETQNIRFWGDTINEEACRYANVAHVLNRNGNYFPCNDGYTWSAPVGTFKANKYGLQDMLGNVWEWCSDNYNSRYYTASSHNNPKEPDLSNRKRSIRGGSWNGRPSGVRAANRNWAPENSRKSNLGFRLVVDRQGKLRPASSSTSVRAGKNNKRQDSGK